MHQIDYFLDFTCPYSAKFYKTLRQVLQYAKETSLSVSFNFHHQIQPWHPSSSLVHEAALAVKRLDPSRFMDYCEILFDNQQTFFDKNTYELCRTEIYKKLVDLACPLGINCEEMTDLLQYSTKPGDHLNEGNEMTAALKRE
jgi:predicted DsbA family dithiol-disulfide isomerase